MTTFTWITPRAARTPNPDLAATVSCLPVKSGRKLLRVAIYDQLLQQLGWELGDHLQIGISDDLGAIAVRQHESGNKLRAGENSTTSILSMTAPAALPEFKAQRLMTEACRVADGVLLLATPWLADFADGAEDAAALGVEAAQAA